MLMSEQIPVDERGTAMPKQGDVPQSRPSPEDLEGERHEKLGVEVMRFLQDAQAGRGELSIDEYAERLPDTQDAREALQAAWLLVQMSRSRG
jgi:hypothetical protein